MWQVALLQLTSLASVSSLIVQVNLSHLQPCHLTSEVLKGPTHINSSNEKTGGRAQERHGWMERAATLPTECRPGAHSAPSAVTAAATGGLYNQCMLPEAMHKAYKRSFSNLKDLYTLLKGPLNICREKITTLTNSSVRYI